MPGAISPAARFRVLGTFEISSRGLFVIYGDIVEGSIVCGMTTRIELNRSVSVALEVHAVEFIDGRASDGSAFSHPALVFKLDPEESNVISALNIQGECLDLDAADRRADTV